MDASKVITDVVNALEDKKHVFLSSVQYEVQQFVANQSIEKCLTIVERNTDGSIHSKWYPKDFVEGYLPRLIAFCRKADYNGRQLDSALTDDVVSIVVKEYEQFYSDNSDLLSKALLKKITDDKAFQKVFTDNLSKSMGGTVPVTVKNKIAALLIAGLHDGNNISLVDSAAKSIGDTTTKIVSYAASVPIIKTITTFIVTHFGFQIKMLIIKVLSTAAAKGMLVALMKKVVAAKILSAIIILVGAKIGVASGGALIPGLVLILGAFIVREIYVLPKKLSEKVSTEIRNELSGEFKSVNTKVVSEIFASISTTAMNGLLADMMNTKEFKDGVNTLLKAI
jgi:hypothetical protein